MPADHDDVEDTVLSPSSPNAVPVETILPPADTIAPPLGGHTLDLRPVGGAEQGANEVYDEPDDGDHDGATISVAQARALRGESPDPIPSSAAHEAGPSAGPRIRMSTGQVVALDRTVVIGRRPRATRSSAATLPHLIAVDSPEQDISRSHLEIRPEADAVVVLDLHTTNGSTLLRARRRPRAAAPGRADDRGHRGRDRSRRRRHRRVRGSAVSRPPSPPPQLDGFAYVEPLGTGGFADVFLYEQQMPRRRVAVKVLLADRARRRVRRRSSPTRRT